MRKSLTKKERLKKQADISRVFSSGLKVSCFGAKLVYRQNGLTGNRIAVTPVKRYGNAIRRNRAKRTMREAYRQIKHELLPGYDMAVVLYPGNFNYRDRERQLHTLLSKAQLFECSCREI